MTIKYIPFESRTGFKSPGFEVTPDGDVTLRSLTLGQNSFLDVAGLSIGGRKVINDDDSSLSLGDDIINSSLERLGTLQFLNVDGDVIIGQASSSVISIVNGEVRIASSTNTIEETYNNISQTLYGATAPLMGTGATFRVTRSSGTYSVVIVSQGLNYLPVETITIPGTYLGGESPTNDLTITIDVASIEGRIEAVSASGAAVSSSVGSINNMSIGLTTPADAKFLDAEIDTATVSTSLTVTGTIEVEDLQINNLPTEVYHATRRDYVDNRISAFSIAFGA